MELIKNLEQKILNRWKVDNFHLSVFPRICADILREADFSDPLKLVKDSLTHMPFGEQNHQRGVFADIPFTILKNEYFSIDLFFWFHAHTSIHDHPFVGAFKIIKGSSRHLVYDFNNRNEVESWLIQGKLELVKDEFIEQNHVQEVSGGFNYIHQVLHRENPTVTIIVKSNQRTEFRDYIYPCFAWVDRNPEPDYFRALSLVSSYFKFHYSHDPKSCHSMLEKAFPEIPAHDLFLMTYNYPALYSDRDFQNALENLILSDLRRFAWYNELKSARISHENYILGLGPKSGALG